MFQFRHPLTCIIAGPTQSGKTYFIFDLLKNIHKLFTPVPSRIIWCYGEYQELLKTLPPNVEICEGLNAVHELTGEESTLVIVDDLMEEAGKEIANLFTKGSHHKNLSIIMVVQNIFHQSKIMRTISLNAHYLVLFKNPRDAGQIRHLATQLFPGNSAFLVDAYRQATQKPHGYLVLDLTQDTSDNQRVLSDILPAQEGFYYIPK
jgi:hypothetical protein